MTAPRRPGAGVRVGGGRLRVDVARAIDKLRSYQLADPTGWVLEVVRAGVARQATAIAVEGSASDVFVAMACEPIAADSLPRLFDELVDPSPDPALRVLHLLAMGVNAALGREATGARTRFVDVYTLGEGGSARTRFTPGTLAASGEGAERVAAGLRALTVERSQQAPRRGVEPGLKAQAVL